MYEYVFFEAGMRARFAEYVEGEGAECHLDEEELIARVPEEIDDALAERIDDCYEKILQETGEMFADTEMGLERNVAGVQVQLANGSPCTIRIDPDILGRVLESLSMEEFRDLCQVIAEGVERRDDRPICQIED